MKKRAILVLGLILIAGLLVGNKSFGLEDKEFFASSTPVSGCTSISSPGTYVLQSDISTLDAICFSITSSNVIFDCNNHDISYATDNIYSSKAISVNNTGSLLSNITVKNCVINEYGNGVYYNNVTDSYILDNTVTQSCNGLNMYRVHNSVLSNNYVSDSELACGTGTYLYNSTNNNLTNNNMSENRENGIYLHWNSNNNQITENTIQGNFEKGIYLNFVSGNTFLDNNITGNGAYGVYIYNESNGNEFGTNSIIARDGVWDFYSEHTNSGNFIDNVLLTDRNVSLNYSGGVKLRYALADAFTVPEGYVAVSSFFNLTNTSTTTWVLINVSYTEGSVDESNVSIWRYSGGQWYACGEGDWSSMCGKDTTGNWVWANISRFSIFSPFGIEAETDAPTVVINSPDNTTYSSNSTDTIDFNFTVTDASSISKVIANVSNSTSHVREIELFDDGSGSYVIAPGVSIEFPDAVYNVTAFANDTYNNINNSEWVVFTIDTIAPNITLHLPANTTYNSTSRTLNVSATETIDTWQYSLNGAANVTFTPNTTLTAAEGFNNLTVYANDTAGNLNSTETIYFTIDSTTPKYYTVSDNSSGTVENGTTVKVSSYWNDSLSNMSVCQVLLNDTGSFTVNNTSSISGNSGWCNTTIDTSDMANQYVCWKAYANDSSNNMNNSMSVQCINITYTPDTNNNNDNTGGSGSSSGSSSGSPVTTSANAEESKSWFFDMVSPETPGEMDLSGDMIIHRVRIEVRNSHNNVQINLEQYSEDPNNNTSPEISVFKYLDVSATNLPNEELNQITFEFKVSKEWLEDNDISEWDVVMKHYVDGVWETLTVEKSSEDDEYVYYSATTESLSSFVIGGTQSTSEVESNQTIVVEENETVVQEDISVEENSGLFEKLIIGLIAGLILAGVYNYIKSR